MLPVKVDEKRDKAVYELIKENVNYSLSVSSVSGVSHISYGDGRTRFERFLWILVILLMVWIATTQGLKVYSRYIERPVIVTVDKSFFDWQLAFPTTTMCFKQLKMKEELTEIIKNLVTKYNLSEEILTTKNKEFVDYLEDLAFKNYLSYQDYDAYASGLKKEFLSPNQYMEVLDEVIWIAFSQTKTATGSVFISPVNLPFNEQRPVLRIFTEHGPCMVINPNVGIYFTPGYFNISVPYNDYKPIYYTRNVMASMTLKIGSRGSTDIFIHAANEVVEITDKGSSIPEYFFKHSKYETDIVNVRENVKLLSVKIGGIFSLFLGCSLLSFIEIAYFLTMRMFFGVRSRNKG